MKLWTLSREEITVLTKKMRPVIQYMQKKSKPQNK